ncbi:cysteine proteinase [Tuber magnatum]|uniref:ubiquitinyl hydrolase 1 n=1 Tax=Tuber magnatum TaxID=42249 RepID=A0A317SUZ7_9PEZI|nr:cysteine proteinase [Tuber magnatum]
MPIPPWIQPRLFSGDLYGGEEKPRKSLSKSDDSTSTNVVVEMFWNYQGILAAAWGIHSSLPGVSMQVTKIANELAKAGIRVEDKTVQRVLRGRYANGDVDKALQLLVMIEDSNDGIVSRVRSDVKMLGAENHEGVTCYLDTLLFAMFARLDAFEAVLYNVFDEDDKKRRKLAALLRLFVNLLRSGHLITTDIISQIQQSITECGWGEASSHQQQDPSEVFTFITDTLQLPLLTVKVDIAHGGKEIVEDDHKFISERLLNVALPDEGADSRDPIPLEACLEEYFNGRVDVKRQLERRATADTAHSYDMEKGSALHIETVDLGSSPNTPVATPISSQCPSAPVASVPGPSAAGKPLLVRTIKVESEIEGKGGKLERSTTLRKEVLLPAWCFFSILPFYTDTLPTPAPKTFAEHFSAKRPVLGLCLKRYSWSTTGGAQRDRRRVDIPLQIALPTFVADDEMGGDDDGPLYGNFKLVLQSAVCHRGNSVHSGHYIALIRGEDDKVSEIEPERAFEEESPYLLFYQVQPIEDDTSATTPSVASTMDYPQEKRLSVISGGSGGSCAPDLGISRSSAKPNGDEPPTFSDPPVYEKHDSLERCPSPPPPYIVESKTSSQPSPAGSSPTAPVPTVPYKSLLDPEAVLRPTSRSNGRPDSKDGPLVARSSSHRSKTLMTRARSQDKEKGRKSSEWARIGASSWLGEGGGRDERRESELPSSSSSFGEAVVGKGRGQGLKEAVFKAMEKKGPKEGKERERGKGKDKGKGKETVRRRGSRDKDLRECVIQ